MREPKLNRLSACLPARRAQAGNAQAGAREKRITDEIVVDAYTSDERAMMWYYYLEEKLKFPFKAKCVSARSVSPLTKGEEVEVLGMAKEDDCMREMFVLVRFAGRRLGVPLAIFDDRVEVWSAGRFPTGITPESLKHAHPSVQRNPIQSPRSSTEPGSSRSGAAARIASPT